MKKRVLLSLCAFLAFPSGVSATCGLPVTDAPVADAAPFAAYPDSEIPEKVLKINKGIPVVRDAAVPPIQNGGETENLPELSFTVLADTGLSPAHWGALAVEIEGMKDARVSVLLRGLPMKKHENGRLSPDKEKALQHLLPFLRRGHPAAVDPTVFRAVRKTLHKDFGIPVSEPIFPATIVRIGNRSEIVLGTISPRRAASELLESDLAPVERALLHEAAYGSGVLFSTGGAEK